MKVRGMLAALGAGGLLLAGCGDSGPAAQASYCVNGAGMVVDAWHCGGTDPLYWYWLGSFASQYRTGQVIHVTNVHVTHVHSTDPTARRRWGMPPTGTVRSGTTFRPPPPKPSAPSQARSGATAGVNKPPTQKQGPAPRPPAYKAPAPAPRPAPPAPRR